LRNKGLLTYLLTYLLTVPVSCNSIAKLSGCYDHQLAVASSAVAYFCKALLIKRLHHFLNSIMQHSS